MVDVNFGPGSGPIFLSSLSCSGTESSLLNCNAFRYISAHNCDHSKDVGVICECKYNTAIYSQFIIHQQYVCDSCPYIHMQRDVVKVVSLIHLMVTTTGLETHLLKQ